MKIELNKEILEYVEQNTEAEGILTSCKEILIPYILKNHKESLKEYIELDNIELVNVNRETEARVLYTDRVIKIEERTFKNIEKELIQPLFHSLKDLNLKHTLEIGCYLHRDIGGGESRFSGAWREFRIANYGYQERLICPSLNTY